MDNLSFGSFTWRQNPVRFSVEQRRKPIYAKNEMGVIAYTGLTQVGCTVTGSGVFTGKEAWTDYLALQKLLDAPSPATLQHPRWGSCKAYLTGLQMTEEPKDSCISYQFTFLRADAQGAVPQV